MVNTLKQSISGFCTYTVIAFLLVFLGVENTSAQGLRFNSNDSLINKRTSYSVFEEKTPRFSGQLSIAFDLSLWDVEHFGYILNIMDGGENSYSLTYNHLDNRGNLYFNIDGKTNKLKIPLAKELLIRRNWMKLRLLLDLENDQVQISLNDRVYRASGFGFKKNMQPKLVFGRNERYTDVPDMAIRKLTVSDRSQLYTFPLDEWEGEQVHNKQGDPVGSVQNPNWLINESYSWRPVLTQHFQSPEGLNFDAASHSLILFGRDSLVRYNVLSSDMDIQPYSTPMPMNLLLGKSVMNPAENSLYAYELYPPEKGKTSIAALNLQDLSWKVTGRASLDEQRHHHNGFYDPATDGLYVFGGYGGYAYHRELFRYNRQKDHWEELGLSGDPITPRFFSAFGLDSTTKQMYIFGGYGNESGSQVVGGLHYYDLYSLDLSNGRISKRWEIKPKEKPFVPANNLIFSPDGRYFYALCYPHEDAKTFLRLYRFSVADGSYEIVSGQIPAVSERIESDINLFFDKTSDQFICTIQEFSSPEQSVVKIFSLSNPPVTEQMYLEAKSVKPSRWFMIALAIGGLLALVVFYFVLKMRRRTRAKVGVGSTSDLVEDSVPPVLPVLATDMPLHSDVYVPLAAQEDPVTQKPNSIYLLGDFAVYDNQAKNITHQFSPKIQQLFVLILLNSKEGDGVTSKRISANLWPEKELSKTKNIKGVTINHLRSILRDLDGIELSFQNDHYKFRLEKSIYCDYFEVLDYLKRGEINELSIANYLPAMLQGGLLPVMQDPWIDGFKNSFEEVLTQRLQPEMAKAFDSEHLKLALDLAKIVLKVDPFNDYAIKFQLSTLRRLKGKDVASKCFQQFKDEYQDSLGIQYPHTFEELCK